MMNARPGHGPCNLWWWTTVSTLVLMMGFPAWIAAADDGFHEHYEIGKARMNAGAFSDAADAFSRALDRLDESDHNYWVVLLSRSQAHFRKGDHNSALRDAAGILRSQSSDGLLNASAYHIRGLIHLKTGEDKKAVQEFTAAIKEEHDDDKLRARSFANRGVVFINLGEPDKAISDLNKALDLDPKLSFALASRGLAHLRKDRMDRARLDSEKALSMNPDDQTAMLADRVLRELSVSFSGPDRISVPMNDDGQIFVQVKFSKDGKPYRFLLDTGATHSLVGAELLRKISADAQVKEVGKGKVTVADGSSHRITKYRVSSAFLYNLPLGEIEVLVFDDKHKGASNLLGTKSLRQVSISIDNGAKNAEIRMDSAKR
ncbi:MAG: tetratricopeptide repeat protein [Pseudomonadota bacterium]